MFVPPDVVSQLSHVPPAECEYCSVWPSIPCYLHQGSEPAPPALELVPVSRKTAKAFVREHHRHSRRPPAAEVLRAGLARGDQLVAVALAGLPARELMDGRSLEVTRVCTDGSRNACSMLYGALARAAKALGYRRLYTYTLASEPGTSPRAAGFVQDAVVPARQREVKNGARPRYQENLLGERVVDEDEEKIRWRRDL